MTDGILNRSLWKALLVWIGSNCGLTLISCLLVVYMAVINFHIFCAPSMTVKVIFHIILSLALEEVV
jgi:hypothetical protein